MLSAVPMIWYFVPFDKLFNKQGASRLDELMRGDLASGEFNTTSPQDIKIAEEYLYIVIDYLKAVISTIRSKYSTISIKGKLGLKLIVVGACDALSTYKNINGDIYKNILERAISLIEGEEIKNFSDQVPGLKSDIEACKLINASYNSMETILLNKGQPYDEILVAFNYWVGLEEMLDNNSLEEGLSSIQNNEGLVTIMFTDISSFDRQATMLGDEKSLDIVKISDDISSQILKELKGDKIRSTGRGLVAIFKSVSQAIDAGLKIQNKIDEHNIHQEEDEKIRLKIGLNCGEPKYENDDIYGLSVDLAEKICNFANSGKVIVSNTVKELSPEDQFNFKNLGPYELPNIEAQQILFEVGYND